MHSCTESWKGTKQKPKEIVLVSNIGLWNGIVVRGLVDADDEPSKSTHSFEIAVVQCAVCSLLVRLAAVYFLVSDDADLGKEDNSKQNAYTQKQFSVRTLTIPIQGNDEN